MKHMPARAAMLDLAGRYEFVNECWERTMGLTAEEVVGRGYDEVLSPNSAAGFAPYHRRVAETGAPVSRVFQTGAGESVRWWCSTYFPIPDADGKLTLIGAVAMDITEQKVPKLMPVDGRAPGRAL
jgi:PAS domain S-box-containing protein